MYDPPRADRQQVNLAQWTSGIQWLQQREARTGLLVLQWQGLFWSSVPSHESGHADWLRGVKRRSLCTVRILKTNEMFAPNNELIGFFVEN
jgi:hypothetical protein